MTYRIGITGGIGSGKTTIADIFDTLGIPTYNADYQAKILMNTDADLIVKIKKLFGDQAYGANQLDRTYIAKKVFNDNDLLKQLNRLVHPKVFKDLNSWFEQCDTKYALYESALIYQGDAHKYLDKIIYTYASSAERIRRITDRNGLEKKEIEARMSVQPDPISSIIKADYIIINEHQPVIPQVMKIHRHLMAMT